MSETFRASVGQTSKFGIPILVLGAGLIVLPGANTLSRLAGAVLVLLGSYVLIKAFRLLVVVQPGSVDVRLIRKWAHFDRHAQLAGHRAKGPYSRATFGLVLKSGSTTRSIPLNMFATDVGLALSSAVQSALESKPEAKSAD